MLAALLGHQMLFLVFELNKCGISSQCAIAGLKLRLAMAVVF
jgi:hypothetical protein